MNPYRDNIVAIEAPRRSRKRRAAWWKDVGILLAFAAPNALPLFASQWGWSWGLRVCGVVMLFGVVMAFVGRSRTAHGRLCALVWNRGDRFGAMLLRFGVIQPRYSAKRIARNKAALEAASAGMPRVVAHVLPGVKADLEE